MNSDQTSLDRLHDLVLPAEVSWWPLAPGWYVVLVLVMLAACWYAWRAWAHWRANAYRRDALRELQSIGDVGGAAELLRRTALARVPRPVIAGLTGSAWLDWLAAQAPVPMPDVVRRQLSEGVYGPSIESSELNAVRDYASHWIARHVIQLQPGEASETRGSL